MLNKELLLSGKVKLYNIIRGTVSNVSLSYSPQTDIKAGTRVNITVNANSGYQNPSVSVTKNDGTGSITVSGSGSNRYFMMPKSDVTINASASLIPTYSISGSASGGGISFSKTSGIRAGETITVYLSPNFYHVLSSLTSSPSVSFSGSGNTRTFKMPSSNVKVTAKFSAEYTHIINTDSRNKGGYTVAGWLTEEAAGYSLGSINTQNFNGHTLIGIYSHKYRNPSSIDAYVIFRNKPPYPKLRITFLEMGKSIEMTNIHRNGYGKSYDAPFGFALGSNVHIKLEFLS